MNTIEKVQNLHENKRPKTLIKALKEQFCIYICMLHDSNFLLRKFVFSSELYSDQ